MSINTDALIYSRRTEIPFYDADYTGRLKLSAILKIFSQLAGDEYIERGLSHHFLEANGGYAFLMSRLALKIKRWPENEEFVTSSTWEYGKKGALFLRGCEMTDEAGNVIVDGEAGWICVSMADRKIIRPKEFPWLCTEVEGKVPEYHVGKIPSDDTKKIGEYEVKLTDADVNGHMYNAFYGDIISNALGKEIFERGFSEFKLNYISEVGVGEKLELYKKEYENGIILIGNKKDGTCFEFSGIISDIQQTN